MCAAGFGFPKAHRLRQRDDYTRLNKMGRKKHSPHFIVLTVAEPPNPVRLGITVSRKVGNAIVRNRVKRLIREYFRNNYSQLPEFQAISVIAKKGAGTLTQAAVDQELADLLLHRDK